MKKRYWISILLIAAFVGFGLYAYGGSITKGLIGKQDISKWDGATSTFTRTTADDYTLTLNKIDWPGVDVLAVYGGGVNRTKATLSSALTGVGTVNKVRFFLSPGEWAITDDLTITSNVTLYVPPGASLAVTAGKTLTIDGPIEAGPYQIFSGTGVVAGNPIVDQTIPEWWGAVGNGTTDDYTAVNAAFTHWFQRTIPGKFKFLSGKNYLIETAITKTFASDILGAWIIDGYGSRVTSGVAAGTLITFNNNTTDLRGLSIHGLYFYGCGSTDSLLKLDGGDDNTKYFYNVSLRDLFFANFDGNGLTLEGNIFESVLTNVRSQGKSTNTAAYPIYINNGAGTGTVSSVSLYGCSTSYGLYGLYVATPTGDVKVQESTFLSAQDYGAYLDNHFGSTVLNCHFENNWQSEVGLAAGQAGLYLNGAGTIQGCYATGNYQQHLAHIYSNTHVSIINNIIAAPLTSMVYVDGAAGSFVTIIGNEDWLGKDDAPNVKVSRIGYTYKSFEAVDTVGAGADTLMSYTLLDDNLGKYEGLRITAFGTKTAANGNKTIIFHFGATTIEFNAAANDVNDWRFTAEVCNYRDATVQMISWVGYNGTTILQGYEGAAEDTTGGDITIKITGECANASDKVTQLGLIIERF